MPRAIVILGLVLAACSPTAAVDADPPPPTTAEEVASIIEASEVPVIVNVWASWCVPCRSEAPLLSRAADRHGNEVLMLGLNVRDTPNGAARFIGEFFPDAAIVHLADSNGGIPIDLGGSRGVPLTFFYRQGGELSFLHYGVIDERTLALQIDEIVNG